MGRKVLRVHFIDDETPEGSKLSVASSIQIVLPDEMAFADAEEYIKYRLTKEIDGYAASECAHYFFKE